MPTYPFKPQIITVFEEGYSFSKFAKDLLAGIIVGIVALPLSIAFAIASGVQPEQGLITAFIGGFLISSLSGSRVQIGGPTGAFIVIIFDIVQKHGYEGLAIATLMAGILLIIMGLSRMGDVIKFIPYPVTVGFTSGIALIIFTTQIPDFFGLTLPAMPNHFIDKWKIYIEQSNTFNINNLFLGLATVLCILLWPKITRRIPGTIVAIILTTFAVHFFHIPVETIGSRFGEISNKLPTFHFPHINLDTLTALSSSALAIALLAGIESLLSAVIADGMTGGRHRSNMELIAQGVANVISPLFNGIPATGAIARTATNIKNGGQTPIAGIIHSIVILLIFLFFGHWAKYIPMATLAGILIVVAYYMSEWRLFTKLLKSPRGDVAVLLITFGLTILVDLTVAIEIGMVLAAFLFMRRVALATEMKFLNEHDEKKLNISDGHAIPDGIEIFEINGPFFFGAADQFRNAMVQVKRLPQVLILRMPHVPFIDATGIRALEDLLHKAKRDRVTVILSAVNDRVLETLVENDIHKHLGKNNIQPDFPKALERAKSLLHNTSK